MDYYYIKNHCRLKTVNLSRQEELDVDLKAIQQIECVTKRENTDGVQSMFVLTFIDKIKESRLKFSQGGVTFLQKMAKYEEERVKLTNNQLKKLKSPAKNKTGTTLKIKKKTFKKKNCHM